MTADTCPTVPDAEFFRFSFRFFVRLAEPGFGASSGLLDLAFGIVLASGVVNLLD